MLGVHHMDNEDYGRFMEAHVATMEPEKREALINAIKLVFRCFIEDETQGVLILLDNEHCMTTMGLNASYVETERLVTLAMGLFMRDAAESEQTQKH